MKVVPVILVICEVKLIHIDDTILNEEGMIDQNKIDLVGQNGWRLLRESKAVLLYLRYQNQFAKKELE